MAQESDLAWNLATEVLARIIAGGGPAWRVLGVDRAEEKAPPATDPTGVHHLRVTLGDGSDDEQRVAVYFTAGVPLSDAIVATANQIQDHVIEATHGAALPRCPAHQHPLQATLVDGEPRWVCPPDASHHSEAILSASAV
jgi:hypothetical protein